MQKTKMSKMSEEIEQPVTVNEEVEQPDYKDMYVRLLADFDNYKKRKLKEIDVVRNTAGRELILKLIPAIDDCENAYRIGHNNAGVQLIYTKILNVLKECGAEQYGEIGENFNPELHDAVSISNDGKVEENHISNVFKKGYRLNGEIIRHALVVVEKTEE